MHNRTGDFSPDIAPEMLLDLHGGFWYFSAVQLPPSSDSDIFSRLEYAH